MDNLALLATLDEKTLLEELRVRYSRDIIYVSTCTLYVIMCDNSSVRLDALSCILIVVHWSCRDSKPITLTHHSYMFMIISGTCTVCTRLEFTHHPAL